MPFLPLEGVSFVYVGISVLPRIVVRVHSAAERPGVVQLEVRRVGAVVGAESLPPSVAGVGLTGPMAWARPSHFWMPSFIASRQVKCQADPATAACSRMVSEAAGACGRALRWRDSWMSLSTM